jgi:hypothetical protein
MSSRLDVNVTTGQASPVPLTAAEQAAFDAALAAAPAIAATQAAAQANSQTLNNNVRGALVRLRQIQGANPAAVTLPQVAQAVSDIAGYLIAVARILSEQYDATT